MLGMKGTAAMIISAGIKSSDLSMATVGKDWLMGTRLMRLRIRHLPSSPPCTGNRKLRKTATQNIWIDLNTLISQIRLKKSRQRAPRMLNAAINEAAASRAYVTPREVVRRCFSVAMVEGISTNLET